MIFHNFVLICEFKYNLVIMQLRLQPRNGKSLTRNKIIIKTVLVVFILFLAVILLDKIDVSVPSKLIKHEISNDKLITLK